jgi:hypothetical protein
MILKKEDMRFRIETRKWDDDCLYIKTGQVFKVWETSIWVHLGVCLVRIGRSRESKGTGIEITTRKRLYIFVKQNLRNYFIVF